MGGRGSFLNVNNNNFIFKEGGQTYLTVAEIGKDIKIIKKITGSVKAPEFSHTESRIYAVLQKHKIKHIAFYNENHEQIKCIDFNHSHKGLIPHVHYNLNHDGYFSSLSEDDKVLVKEINDFLEKGNKRYGK